MTPELLPAEAFRGRRLEREGTWIVAFLADWCPFCRTFRPQFEALSGGGLFRSGIADLSDIESSLWDDFQVDVVPALVVFSNGRPIYQHQSDPGVGLPPDALDRARAEALAAAR